MKKQELDFHLSLQYFADQLNGGNELSQELIKYVNFKEGNFYTLLPEQSIRKNLYDFQSGGFLPQNPEEEYYSEGKRAIYSIIPTMHDEIADFIFQKLIDHKKLSCIFEELLDSPSSPQLKFFQEHNLVVLFNDEVYYLIQNLDVKLDLLVKCIKKSNAIWHSLCVLTAAGFEKIIHKNLTPQKIREICSLAHLIVVGAYDGEGYIFWEKA